MYSIHPLIQLAALLIALYAFFLGINRFRVLHLHQKAPFTWKRHVFTGAVAIVVWFVGLFGGMAVVYWAWGSVLMTGTHGQIAILFLPLLLFGLISGMFMHRFKKKRTVLPLIHGINNLLLILLVFWQIKSGWEIYVLYVLGW